MGKPKRLYDNFIDPDVYRIDDLVRLAKSAGLCKEEPPSMRRSIVPNNPSIFDVFYREVVSTVSDYPYYLFIDHANKAYDEVCSYIVNEACENPYEGIPGWVKDIFACVEWYPVKTYIGDMPKMSHDEILRDCKMSLESVVGYKIKSGGKAHDIISQVFTSIVAIVMGKVYDNLRNHTAAMDGKLVAFPNIPVKVLWDSSENMSPTVMTKWDLDFAIRALHILSYYGVNANVSQLVWLASTATLLYQAGELGDTDEYACDDRDGASDAEDEEDEDALDEECH